MGVREATVNWLGAPSQVTGDAMHRSLRRGAILTMIFGRSVRSANFGPKRRRAAGAFHIHVTGGAMPTGSKYSLYMYSRVLLQHHS